MTTGAVSGTTLTIDDIELLRSACVCKAWRDDPVLREKRQEAAQRLRTQLAEYPRPLVNVFHDNRISILQLPTLNELKDFPRLSPDDLSHPIMQFSNSKEQRGIVVLTVLATHRAVAMVFFHSQKDRGLACIMYADGTMLVWPRQEGIEFLRNLLTGQDPNFRLYRRDRCPSARTAVITATAIAAILYLVL